MYERVRVILEDDREILETLARRLLEQEVVDESELRELMGLPPRTRLPSEDRVVTPPPPQSLSDETRPGGSVS
jgi:hypothetical protein